VKGENEMVVRDFAETRKEKEARIVRECQFELATEFNVPAKNIIGFHGARIDKTTAQMAEFIKGVR
jgi:hypothetical protein